MRIELKNEEENSTASDERIRKSNLRERIAAKQQQQKHRKRELHVCTHDDNGCGIIQDGEALLKPDGTRGHHNDQLA